MDDTVDLISAAFTEAYRKHRHPMQVRTGTVIGFSPIDQTTVVLIDGDDDPVEVDALGSSYPDARVAVLFGPGGSAAVLGTYGSIWRPYEVEWITQGLAPGVGANDVLEGWYLREGAICRVVIDLRCGSTISGGSEQMSFSLPFVPTVVDDAVGDTLELAQLNHPSSGVFIGFGAIHAATSPLHGYVTPYMNATVTDVRLTQMQNADATNAVGTGVPLIVGGRPLVDGSYFRLKGWYRCD